MQINFNLSAIIANNALNNSDNALGAALERLSTGLRINHAKDDASGLAIAKRMNAQIEGLNIASTNANTGVAIIETAEGALTEIHAMLQRMNELAVKSSNGTYLSTDRLAIQNEINQLSQEIVRIAEDTEFNGQSLLNGNFDVRGYSSDPGLKIDTYSDETTAKDYRVTVIRTATYDVNGVLTGDAKVDLGSEFPAGCKVKYNGNEVTVSGPNSFEIKFHVDNGVTLGTPSIPGPPVVPGTNPITLDIAGIGPMQIQIGANEGQELGIRIPKISLKTLDIDNLDLTTEMKSSESMERISNGIAYVSQVRARLGAYQNRLEHTASSLDITSENMTSAYSRIMDVNMATEMTEYTKYQIMSQAGTSMLAQANERPQKILQMLQ